MKQAARELTTNILQCLLKFALRTLERSVADFIEFLGSVAMESCDAPIRLDALDRP
jgi:hypothetical protein